MRLASILSLPLALGVLCTAAPLVAQTTTIPAGTTGICKDGSYSTAKSKSGACSNHGGVKQWLAGATTAPATGAATTTATKTASKTKAAKNKAANAAAPATAEVAAPKPAATPKTAAATIPVGAIAGAPAAATALCNDGTYSESQHRTGSCSKHKGVKQWLKNLPPQ